jgi:hypothetical protein
VQSDTFPLMEMATHGDLRVHWGAEGIRINRLTGGVFKTLTPREARWLGTILPIVAATVEAHEDD